MNEKEDQLIEEIKDIMENQDVEQNDGIRIIDKVKEIISLKEGELKGDLLQKDNHILGCMLEGYVNVLEYRGFEKEARIIENVASRIK